MMVKYRVTSSTPIWKPVLKLRMLPPMFLPRLHEVAHSIQDLRGTVPSATYNCSRLPGPQREQTQMEQLSAAGRWLGPEHPEPPYDDYLGAPPGLELQSQPPEHGNSASDDLWPSYGDDVTVDDQVGGLINPTPTSMPISGNWGHLEGPQPQAPGVFGQEHLSYLAGWAGWEEYSPLAFTGPGFVGAWEDASAALFPPSAVDWSHWPGQGYGYHRPSSTGPRAPGTHRQKGERKGSMRPPSCLHDEVQKGPIAADGCFESVAGSARRELQEGWARLQLRLALRKDTAKKNPKGWGPRAGQDHIFKNSHLGRYINKLLDGEFRILRQGFLDNLDKGQTYRDNQDAVVCPKFCIGSTTILVLSEHICDPREQQISWTFSDRGELRGTTFPGAQTFLLAVDEKEDENPFIARLLHVIRESCNTEVWYKDVGYGDFPLQQ